MSEPAPIWIDWRCDCGASGTMASYEGPDGMYVVPAGLCARCYRDGHGLHFLQLTPQKRDKAPESPK